MAAMQYDDLPMIPSMEAFNYNSCGTDHQHHVSTYRYPFESMKLDGDFRSADNYEHGMVMGRFMQDPYAVTPCLLQANTAMRPVEHQIALQYPIMDYRRQVSPCSSGQSSDPAQSDFCSPHAQYPSYGSPKDIFSHATAPYPTTERFQDEEYLSQPLLQGGCSLRELEYSHPELIAEEVVEAEVKEEVVVEHLLMPTKVETNAEDTQGDADSGIGNSVRDAESVQPIDMEQDPASDSDYSPTSSRSGKRRRSSTSNSSKASKRRNSTRKDSTASSSTSPVRSSRKAHRSTSINKAPVDPNDDRRCFPCTLANYGCSSTFASKNEWKRHMSTQHIKLSYWRCDLCTPNVDQHDDTVFYYNDFNRKDLFTQHLRRMHAVGNKDDRPKSQAMNDDNLIEHQTRCRKQLRAPPQRSACLFCDKGFEGPTSWEERMEHVGKHLEKDRKNLPDMLDNTTWNHDMDLEDYLANEGLITREGAQWKIGDGKPVRQAMDETDSEEE